MRLKRPLRTAFGLLVQKTPLEAQLIVTRNCNLSCGYCTEFDNHSKPVPTPVLKERIDALHRLRVMNTSMLGGEPLLHPDIVELTAYSNRKNQVSITTNGFLLTKDLILQLNDAGLANMEMSIDSFKADKTGFIQKTLKTLLPKMELLKKYAQFDFHANVVLCEGTKHDLKETVKRIREFGSHVSIDLLHTDKGEIDIQGEDYAKVWDDHFNAGNTFTDIDQEYGRKLLLEEKPKWKCRTGSRALYIDEFGYVQYCSSNRTKLSKPVTEYTLADLKEQSSMYKGCEEGCALICMYRDSMIDNEPFKVLGGAYRAIRRGVISRDKKAKHTPAPAAATT